MYLKQLILASPLFLNIFRDWTRTSDGPKDSLIIVVHGRFKQSIVKLIEEEASSYAYRIMLFTLLHTPPLHIPGQAAPHGYGSTSLQCQVSMSPPM